MPKYLIPVFLLNFIYTYKHCTFISLFVSSYVSNSLVFTNSLTFWFLGFNEAQSIHKTGRYLTYGTEITGYSKLFFHSLSQCLPVLHQFCHKFQDGSCTCWLSVPLFNSPLKNWEICWVPFISLLKNLRIKILFLKTNAI